MPTQFDNTYHYRFSKPVYDRPEDEKKAKNARVADTVLEMRPPRMPTRNEEVEYMEFLADDFRKDPWFTPRFYKYMASPKRIPWKNNRELSRQYKYTFMLHWSLGTIVSWPVAVMIGRRMKRYQGGTPVVVYNRYVHDFPNLDPGREARRRFRFYSVAASILLGYQLARMTSDNSQILNTEYSRPDLKPFPAMVAKEKDHEKNDVTEKTMLQAHYKAFKKEKAASEKSRSSLYRYFFPLDADWTVEVSPYATHSKYDVYNMKKSHYSTWTNDFTDHVNE